MTNNDIKDFAHFLFVEQVHLRISGKVDSFMMKSLEHISNYSVIIRRDVRLRIQGGEGRGGATNLAIWDLVRMYS